MAPLIMMVEDEVEIHEVVRFALESEGFQLHALSSGEALLDNLLLRRPSLLLVDQLLPGKKGTDLIRDVRATQDFADLPIMLLTACFSEEDKVNGFGAGADDYLTKPFSSGELLGRIRALIRRSQKGQIAAASTQSTAAVQCITHKNVKLDLRAYRAMLDDQEVALTLTEFRILKELMMQKGQAISRTDLCQRVLGKALTSDRTIDVHMAAIRRKLKSIAKDIKTIRGVGYLLVS